MPSKLYPDEFLGETTKYQSLAVSKKIPEHIRDAYPLLVQFVEAYYSYLDTTFIGKIDSIKDIDETDGRFLNAFKKQFAPTVQNFPEYNFRDFVKLAKEFYTSKGSEGSIKLLFKFLFGEEITIDYPGKYILKGSDGKWYQEYSTAVRFFGGTLPAAPFILQITNDFGEYRVEIIRVESLTSSTARLIFKISSPIKIIDQQLVYVKDTNGATIFVGQVNKDASKLLIQNGGADWQVGQVFTIPGTIKNTIAKVTRISDTGGILAIEILDFGIGHTENQITIISPYPTKPTSSEVSIDKILVGVSPNKYQYNVSITDLMSGYTETVFGTNSTSTYFLSDYVLPGYAGEIVITSSTNTVPPVESSFTDISLATWLASRATFVYQFDPLVKGRGFYLNEDGMISNQSIVLEDNFFYQDFSYVIETVNESFKFENSINLVHPAGIKWFSNLRKEFSFDESAFISAQRTLSSETIYISDTISVLDTSAKSVTKPRTDSTSFTDVSFRSSNKYLNDTEVFTDVKSLASSKKLSDSEAFTDVSFRSSNKYLNDTEVFTDVKSISETRYLSDSQSFADAASRADTKYLTDSSTIADSNTATKTITSYGDGTYDTGNYATTNYGINI